MVISEQAEFDERYMLGSQSNQQPGNKDTHEQHYVPLPAIPVEIDEDDDSIQVPLEETFVDEQNKEEEHQDVHPGQKQLEEERPVTPPPQPVPEVPELPLALRC